MVTLDPLLEMFGDVMRRGARQEPIFPGCRDGGRIGPRTIGADPVGGEQRLLLQHLAEEALGGIEVALRREQEVDGVPCLSMARYKYRHWPRILMYVSSTRIEPQWGLRKARSRRSIRGA